MGWTAIAIVSGAAALLATAIGCSSSSVAGATDAAARDARNASELDAEADASLGSETDSSSSSPPPASCASAGGTCLAVSTCQVVGPVHCGSDSLCCFVMTTGSTDAEAEMIPDVCASSACSGDAGTFVDAATESGPGD